MTDQDIMQNILSNDRIATIMGLVNTVMEQSAEWDFCSFCSFLYMLVEEYCFRYGLKVEEVLQTLADTAADVNAAEGRYDPGEV